MPQIDVAKLARYPPEVFLYADTVDLLAGTNTVTSYTNLDRIGWVISFYGASFTPLAGGVFSINVDGISNIARIDDLGSVKGIGYEEEFKVAAFKSMVSMIYAPSATSGYAWRYKLRVDKSTPLLKLLLQQTLTDRERSIAEEYGLESIVLRGLVEQFDPYTNLERIVTVAKSMSSTGTFIRVAVPDGYKLVLLDIAAERPASPDTLTLTVTRDYTTVFDPLDAYCLPGVEHPTWFNARYHSALRIVCVEELLVEATVSSGGPYKVRAVYGLGKLTIPEKVKWGLPLTDKERELAERENIYGLVEAGLL